MNSALTPIYKKYRGPSTRGFKMIIKYAGGGTFIGKQAVASASFCFCSSEKYFSSHLIEHYFVTILCLAHLTTVKVLFNTGHCI